MMTNDEKELDQNASEVNEEQTEVTETAEAPEATEAKEAEAPEAAAEATEAKEEKKEEAAPSAFEQKLRNLNDTKDTTADYDKKDIEDNKAMAILAYIGWLVLIPIFGAKSSAYARYHSNQGLILAIVETVIAVVFGLLGLIPYVGVIFSICSWLLELCCFALFIIGLVNAINGKAKELPIIGGYKLLK